MRALDRLEEALTATLLAAMTVLTFVQVVLRYGFNSGLIWALEATTYLFGWLVLIGISGGVRTNSHIAVELLTDRLPRAARKPAALVAVLLCLVYAVLMGIGSWTLIERLYAFGSLAHDIPLPRWLLLSSLPIGFGLLGLRLVQATMEIIKGTRSGLGPESVKRGIGAEAVDAAAGAEVADPAAGAEGTDSAAGAEAVDSAAGAEAVGRRAEDEDRPG